jgi:hypothetical protein
MEPGLARDVGELVDSLRAGGRRTALIVPLGAGIYHFYGFDAPVRQPWIIPGFFRPYDEPDLREFLSHGRGIVMMRFGGQNAGEKDLCRILDVWNPFSPGMCADLARQLGPPIPIGRQFVLFPGRR